MNMKKLLIKFKDIHTKRLIKNLLNNRDIEYSSFGNNISIENKNEDKLFDIWDKISEVEYMWNDIKIDNIEIIDL